MDFWLRFLGRGGIPLAANGKAQVNQDPHSRLGKFKQAYAQAVRVWNHASITRPGPGTLNEIEKTLDALNTLLEADGRAPMPRLCAEYIASNVIYKAVSRVALSVNHTGVTREAVRFYNTLVEDNGEGLVATEKFAEALTTLVDRLLYSERFVLEAATETAILELMFNVAAELRMQPDLLSVWFRPDGATKYTPTADKSAGNGEDVFIAAVGKMDFPLCRQFLGRVYHDGSTGDFARMGLLYLFEIASRAAKLEHWICNSDLPMMMASGLGALYSQLSRKVHLAHRQGSFPFLASIFEQSRDRPVPEAENISSPELCARLSKFTNYLSFWQDVIEQSRSVAITMALKNTFQVIFLQQILYPSILPPADYEDGSAVATLTYFWHILEVLHRPPLAALVLSAPFPFQSSDGSEASAQPSSYGDVECGPDARPAMLLAHTTGFQGLLTSYIDSQNADVVVATLRLITVLLSHHHAHTASAMMRLVLSDTPEPQRPLGGLISDSEALLSMAQSLVKAGDLDMAYSDCIKDAQTMVESHDCSKLMFSTNFDKSNPYQDMKKDISQPPKCSLGGYHINLLDRLFVSLTQLLESFFSNEVDINIELTGVFAHIASCPYVQLQGWLATSANSGASRTKLHLDDMAVTVDDLEVILDQEENARVANFRLLCQSEISLHSNESVLVSILRRLSRELENATTGIDGTDTLALELKHMFQLEDSHSARVLPPTTREANDIRSESTVFLDGSLSGSTRSKPPEMLATPQRKGALRSNVDGTETSASTPKQPSSPLWWWITGSPAPQSDSRKGAQTTSPPQVLKVHAMQPGSSSSHVEERIISGEIDKWKRVIFLDGAGFHSGDNAAPPRQTTLGKLLTNAIILQEFVLELAALQQVRSSLLDNEFEAV